MAKQAVDAPRRMYFMMDPHEVTIIGIDTEHRSRQEHVHWDPRIHLAVDDLLVKNIRTYGVLKPVLAEKDGEKTVIIDGRQRTRACRLAHAEATAAGEEPPMLPVIFKRGSDAHMFGISRAANQFRRPETAIENAESAQKMLDLGASMDEVAIAFGVSPKTIKDWVALLGLAAPVIKAVAAGEIKASAAAGLAKLSKEDQSKHLAELRAEGGKPTAERVTAKVRKAKGQPVAKTPKTRIAEAVAQIRVMAKERGRSPAALSVLDEISMILCDRPVALLDEVTP